MKNVLKSILLLSLAFLVSCSGSDDNTEPIDNIERYSMSLINNNYDISRLFFIVNNDYDNPIKTCHSFTVRVGDVIKVCGETNVMSNDVFVTAVLKKNSENIKSINLIRSTSYINHPLVVHGSCNSPNSTLNMSDARLWKDIDGNTEFVIEIN